MQIGYVWSEISKTVFKIFLALILRKLRFNTFNNLSYMHCSPTYGRTDGRSDGRTVGKKDPTPLLKNSFRFPLTQWIFTGDILTDVSVFAGSTLYSAHRLVLALSSQYFRLVVTGGAVEGKHPVIFLKVGHVKFESQLYSFYSLLLLHI